MANISVLRLHPLTGTGNLKAFASVQIGEGERAWKINGCQVIQQEGQQAWVSLPQSKYIRDDKPHFYPVVEVPKSIAEAIQTAVLAAWVKGQSK